VQVYICYIYVVSGIESLKVVQSFCLAANAADQLTSSGKPSID